MISNKQSFFEFAYAIALERHDQFKDYAFDPGRREQLERLVRDSLDEAAAAEAADRDRPFEDFLGDYLALKQPGGSPGADAAER